jgi:hypothetical protein
MMWLPRLFERFNEAKPNGGSVCGFTTNGTTGEQPETHACIPAAEVYMQGLFTSLASLPGNILSVLLVDRIGRKPLLGL